MIFRALKYKFTFPHPAIVMGILNVTPDSFSDGGKFFDIESAVSRGIQMAEEGADIIDVGGESTRPQAKSVTEEEELRRVIPVIEMLAKRIKIPISIDTVKPGVARAAIQAGASIINDVGANRADDSMRKIVAETGAGYVLMHMQGTPKDMQINPQYKDVIEEIFGFFERQLELAKLAGISLDQIVLDVGIGFGKTVEHNLKLIAHLERFKALGRPMLLGVSRKSFIGKISANVEAAERLPGSLACVVLGLEAGAHIFRAHDVSETVQALRVAEAVLIHR